MNCVRYPRFILAILLTAQTPYLLRAQQAPVGWHVVYAVDSTGVRTLGDKSTLLAAVRAGQPVRVGWGVTFKLPDSTTSGIEHVADAAFLAIHRGEVFAQISPILGQQPSAKEPVITFRNRNDQLWYALIDTTGRLRGYFTGRLYSTREGADKGPSSEQTLRTATFWYVQGTTHEGPARLY